MEKSDHEWSFFCLIYTWLGACFKLCYIQSHSIINRVIKRFVYACKPFSSKSGMNLTLSLLQATEVDV